MHFTTVHVTSEQHLVGDALERVFTLRQVPGTLWTPASAADPSPLLLIGHPGGLTTVGHTGVPQSASEDASRFFVRHLM